MEYNDQEAKAEALQDSSAAMRNASSVNYNVITLKYANTHGGQLLKYEDDKRVWLLQRHNYGVDYYPTDVSADALAMGARVRYARDGSTGIVCNVATSDHDWAGARSWGDVVRRWNVWDRVDEERGRSYDFWGKNCQHLAYDVHKYTLEDEHISAHGFEQYTEACQERFVSAGRACVL